MDTGAILTEVVTGLIALFFMAATALVPVGFIYLRKKYKWMEQTSVDERLEEVLHNLIHETEKTVVEEIKKTSENGKLTKEEGERIKQEVIRKAIEVLTDGQKKVIEAGTNDLTLYIAAKLQRIFDENKIESQIQNLVNP